MICSGEQEVGKSIEVGETRDVLLSWSIRALPASFTTEQITGEASVLNIIVGVDGESQT